MIGISFGHSFAWFPSNGRATDVNAHVSLSAVAESRYHSHDRCRAQVGKEEAIMREGFSVCVITVAVAAAAVLSMSTSASAQAPAGTPTHLKTPWGEPDLQGIWTDETDTLLQRNPKYAD